MIARYALFEGSVADGRTAAFRAAVLGRLVPLWKRFPGAAEVRGTFGEDRDAGAPEFPPILSITYPDLAAMEGALSSPVRSQSRDVTGKVTAAHFTGRIHNHVTEAHSF